MTEEPNLKEIERKAYMSYHQDGLLDIFSGLYVLGFGLGAFMDVVWDFGMGMILIPGGFIGVALSIWIAAKRRITVPRIGFVKFRTGGTTKLTAIFIGTMVAGLLAFFAFTLLSVQSGGRQWLDLIFQNGMLIVGFGSLAVCFLFGHSMGLKRLYAYGLISVTVLTIGHFTGIFFAYLLFVLGITVMATGITLLIGFVRKYPLKGEKAIAK